MVVFTKIIDSELCTLTLNKPVLSYSAAHASSASNSTGTSILSQLYNKDITKNHNRNSISNTDDIHSCVTPQKQNYSVQDTSTTTHLTSLNTTLTISYVNLHATTKLPPARKEYFCFLIDYKSSHAVQCVKSRIVNKAIDYILSIDTNENKCVVNKGML